MSAPPASIAENSAKLSSPVARASLLVTWLSVDPLVMLTPSANMFRIREFSMVIRSLLAPQ